MKHSLALIKIGAFTLIYAWIYYTLPLPETAGIGFVFPLTYLYPDSMATQHIQLKFFIGFCSGILIGLGLINLTITNMVLGFLCMSLLFCIFIYLSQLFSWLKLPLVAAAAIIAMSFDLTISGYASSISSIAEKLILYSTLAAILYAVIDLLFGSSTHKYNIYHLKDYILEQVKTFNQQQCVIYTISVYLCILSLIILEKYLPSLGPYSALAIASAVVVLTPDHSSTKQQSRLRYYGALAGLMFGLCNLYFLERYPFFGMQVGSLLLVMLYISYLALNYSLFAKSAPQFMMTYILVAVMDFGPSDNGMSAIARVASILLGIIIASLISFIFSPQKLVTKNTQSVLIDEST